MSGPNDTSFGEYPKDFFDLVIIDECHRGGAKDESTWREILKYFDSAVHIGLTATPKEKQMRHICLFQQTCLYLLT